MTTCSWLRQWMVHKVEVSSYNTRLSQLLLALVVTSQHSYKTAYDVHIDRSVL